MADNKQRRYAVIDPGVTLDVRNRIANLEAACESTAIMFPAVAKEARELASYLRRANKNALKLLEAVKKVRLEQEKVGLV